MTEPAESLSALVLPTTLPSVTLMTQHKNNYPHQQILDISVMNFKTLSLTEQKVKARHRGLTHRFFTGSPKQKYKLESAVK